MSDIRRITRDWFEIIISSLVIVFIVKTFFFTTYLVPSSSMYPGICPGEKIIVNRLTDDYKHGDILAFYNPRQHKRRMLKRLIGMPGDTLEIKDGQLYINGSPKKGYEKLSFLFIDPEDLSCMTTLEIKDGYYYFIGDNINGSRDSRYWGQVPESNIIGKAIAVYWPLKGLRRLYGWE